MEKFVILLKKNLKINKLKIKNNVKSGTIVIIQANVPKEILTVFHNRCNYDYHFIIKDDLAEEIEGQLTCSG